MTSCLSSSSSKRARDLSPSFSATQQGPTKSTKVFSLIHSAPTELLDLIIGFFSARDYTSFTQIDRNFYLQRQLEIPIALNDWLHLAMRKQADCLLQPPLISPNMRDLVREQKKLHHKIMVQIENILFRITPPFSPTDSTHLRDSENEITRFRNWRQRVNTSFSTLEMHQALNTWQSRQEQTREYAEWLKETYPLPAPRIATHFELWISGITTLSPQLLLDLRKLTRMSVSILPDLIIENIFSIYTEGENHLTFSDGIANVLKQRSKRITHLSIDPSQRFNVSKYEKEYPFLTHIDLTHAKISGDPARELSGFFQHHPKLKEINLHEIHKASNIRITNQTVIAIAQNCPDLEKLDITMSETTDEGIKELAERCPKLKEVYIEKCLKISPEAELLISPLRPDLRLYR